MLTLEDIILYPISEQYATTDKITPKSAFEVSQEVK